MSETKSLKQKHEEFIARVKANGGKTVQYAAPCCGGMVEDRLAPEGETWDTLTTCPHCEKTFFKVTTSSKVTGELVDGA